MNVSNDQFTGSGILNQAWLDAIGEERAAAWARFFAVAADSNPGELAYDRALAAAKKLDSEIAANKAA
jgi:hypothetical protein